MKARETTSLVLVVHSCALIHVANCQLFPFFFFPQFISTTSLNCNLSFLGNCPVLLFFVLSFIAFPSAVNALTWRLRHPSSKPYLKKVERSHENQHLLFLFLLLLLLFPCLAPSCACVSANTGAWIVDKPPVQLSSAQRSLGNGPTLCNKKTFFFFNSPLHFFFKVSVRKYPGQTGMALP